MVLYNGITKISVLLLLFIAVCFSAYAVCMDPSLYTNHQIIEQAAAAGKTTDAYLSSINRKQHLQGMNVPPPPSRMPLRYGSPKYLVLLIEFSDTNAIPPFHPLDTKSLYSNLLNGTNSVRAYYNEVSYGMYTPHFDVFKLTNRTAYNHDYYINENPYPGGPRKLVEEAVHYAQDQFAGINFADYDNDNNGDIDGIIVIHSGQGFETTSTAGLIHSHMWSLPNGGYMTRNGVVALTYTMQPEYRLAPGDQTIGVFAHELCHVLGGVDVYDTDMSSDGVGNWSLMSRGSWNGSPSGSSPSHLDPWHRIAMGWVKPTVIKSPQQHYKLTNIHDAPQILRINADQSATEYFLIENRQTNGYDSALPGNGICIWHVDDLVNPNMPEWNEYHPMLALEQADGDFDLYDPHDAQQGDAFDPWYTNNTQMNSGVFGKNTTPSSLKYDGTPSGIRISGFSSNDSVMRLNVNLTGDHSGDYSLTRVYDGYSEFHSIASNMTQYYYIDIASQDSILYFQTDGTGDIDIFAKFNSVPSFINYDQYSEGSSSKESITITEHDGPPIQSGRWYLMVYGFSAANYRLDVFLNKSNVLYNSVCRDVTWGPSPVGYNSKRFVIRHLPPTANIEIYNAFGERVYYWTPFNSYGEIIWDLQNEQGIPVAPGIYYISITDGETNDHCIIPFAVGAE